MAMWLRQSTASQEIQLGKFVDDTDGKTAETGLTIANTDIKLFKHGATSQASKNSGGATHIANGHYYAVLDATDTNTLGILEITVDVAGALSVRREFMVVPAMIFDSMILGTDRLDTNVTHVNDTAQTAGDIPAKTNNLPAAPAATGDCITAAGVRAALGFASANADTQLADIETKVDDLETRLGTPSDFGSGATVAANLVDIEGQTDNLPAIETKIDTIDDLLDTEVAAIKAKTDNLPAAPAATGDIPSAATIADAVWDEDATAHQTQGTFGQAIGDPGVDTDTIFGLVNTNLDAAVSSRASQTSVDTLDDYVDSEVAAIKAKTDQLTFTTANQVDAQTMSIAAAAIQAIWDRATSALTTAGSIGKFILDRLDVVLSTRASQTSLDTLDDYVDTEVAAIKAKTDNLPSDPADQSALEAVISPVATQVDELHKFRGLSSGNPWTVTETSEDAGGVTVNFTGDGETTSTATRA